MSTDNTINLSLEVNNLSFSIAKKQIIKNLSVQLESKQKVALVGLNGAGKSSLINLLVGESVAETGDIFYQKVLPTDLKFKQQLGYQPAAMQAIPGMSGMEYLELCCRLKNIVQPQTQIAKVVTQWHLEEIVTRRLTSLSQGNLQKINIAQAFVDQPAYLFLDEPTQALDPIEQQRFIDNLLSIQEFQLCLFSSHHVSEAVQLADLVLMLHHGELIASLKLTKVQQFWLLSELTPADIQTKIGNHSANLSYQKRHKFLYCFDNLKTEEWRQLAEQLLLADPNCINLGDAREALMPIFSLLANEII